MVPTTGRSTMKSEGHVPRDNATSLGADGAWRRAQAPDCLATTRCRLSPKDPKTCCPGQTPHHLIEDEYAKTVGSPNYVYNDARASARKGTTFGKGSTARARGIETGDHRSHCGPIPGDTQLRDGARAGGKR